jgi:NADP-dependent 3-hydroxy acid dehydrogenase YdfG
LIISAKISGICEKLKSMNKITLITGATSGIGKASAEKFAQNGHDVIITGRRIDRLIKLKENLTNNFPIDVTILCFDICNKEEVAKSIDSLAGKWSKIDVLVNNAGLALDLKPIHEGVFENWDTMIDTNIKGLLYISKLVVNLMIENGSGHIINIGSIAGKEVYPNGNVYSATKHAVEGLTKAMRLDLFELGIKVSQIAPGAVNTEFSEVRFHGDKETAQNVYNGYIPLTAEDVAESVYFVASQPEHVNINDLLIMPMAQANATTFNKS